MVWNARVSAYDLEGALAVAPEAEDREMLVEGRRPQDSEPLHDGEARSVDDREVLVAEALADGEGDLEVCESHRLDRCGAAPDRVPVLLRRTPSQTVREQEPRLDKDVVARYEPLAGGEDLLGAGVARISAVSGCVEDRAVDEERQRVDSTASPR